MLINRILVGVVLLPIGLFLVVIGGIPFILTVMLFMGVAAWEYERLFHAGGLKPAGVLVILGSLLILLGRSLNGFDSAPLILTLLIFASMTYHLIAYECGRDQSGTDFGVTVSGFLYIGWLGSYLVSLRTLPEGLWWTLTVLLGVMLADIGAYLIGSSFGRRKLSPRLSPKKTWEGFFGGIVFGTLGSALLAVLWRSIAGLALPVTPLRGALLGFLLAVLTPLGDLGESMIKRQVGVKDSSNILASHGGVLDRIDSWLWAGAIGFYTIIWLFY